VHGEEEEQGARSAVAADLDELQGGVGGEIAGAAEGCAVGTGGGEAAAAFENGGAQGFGVIEEGRDGAIALDAGSAAPIEAQFVGAAGVGVGIGDGIDDGVGDAGGEEIEERGVEVREGSGEGIIDFGGGEVDGGEVSGRQADAGPTMHKAEPYATFRMACAYAKTGLEGSVQSGLSVCWS
jgi:hypothetical protein